MTKPIQKQEKEIARSLRKKRMAIDSESFDLEGIMKKAAKYLEFRKKATNKKESQQQTKEVIGDQHPSKEITDS